MTGLPPRVRLTALGRLALAAPSPVERRSVRSVLGGIAGIVARRGLPALERGKGHERRGDALQLAAIGAERVRRKGDLLHEGQLRADTVALVTGASLLVRLRRMEPPVAVEQRRDAAVVSFRDGYVDVVVRPRHGTHVEVDRPAAEQPVVDPLLPEELIDACQRRELRYCPTGCQTVLSSRNDAMSHGLCPSASP